jgi:RNA polymerase sigma-70 factor (ECF subfamily)
MLEEEPKIVTRAVKGESEAFGLLYDHYQPQIYRFIILKVSRREEAEDLTHQVFVAAWKNMPNYEDQGYPFSSWLYQIARNQVIDHYRLKKPDVSLEEEMVLEIPGSHDTEGQVEERLAIGKVQEALRKLSQEYQDVVIMRFVEELSVREVAQAVGKSEGAIKVMQHRAIKELKKILGDTFTGKEL